MKRFLILFAAFSVLCRAVGGDNLMPESASRRFDEISGAWHCTPFNEEFNQVEFAGNAVSRTLEINRSGAAGYSAWRLFLALEPGEYTLETEVLGTGHAGIDAYAFGDAGPIDTLIMEDFPEKAARPVKVLKHFSVKPGTVKVRFGFNALDTGKVAFRVPRLFKGNVVPEPAAAPEIKNLMPESASRRFDEISDVWHCTPFNEALNQVDFASRADSQTLEINRSGAAGYSAWRLYLALAPGEYTLETEVRGTGRGSLDAYAFNDAGPIGMLLADEYPADAARPVKVLKHFTVQPGTTKVRFGFNALDTGEIAFLLPRLFKGRLEAKELPPRPATCAVRTPAIDVLGKIREFQRTNGGSGDAAIIDPTTGIATVLSGGDSVRNATAVRTPNGWRFAIPNRPVDVSRATWSAEFPEIGLVKDTFAVLTLKVSGMHYSKKAYPVISLGEVTLLSSSEIYSDGAEHTVIIRVPEDGKATSLSLDLRTDSERLDVELSELRILPDLAGVRTWQAAKSAAKKGIEFVDLSSFHRSRIDDELSIQLGRREKVYDAAMLPEKGEVEICGARFAVNGKRVLVKGSDVIRRPAEMEGCRADNVHPKTPWEKALDAAITIPLSGKARELWLLLGAQMTPFPAADAPPAMPPRFQTHEVLDVEIVYADGTVDHSYPYSLQDKGFTVQRFIGAYAVTLDPARELSKVVIHGYFRGAAGAVSVAGATLNRTQPALIPEAVRNPEVYAVKTLKEVPEKPLAVTHKGDVLTLENGAYRLVMQVGKSFAVTEFVQKLNPSAPMTVGKSGLEVEAAGKFLTGSDFEVRKVTANAEGAELLLQSKDAAVPLEIRLAVQGDSSMEIRLNATLRNCGTEPVAPRVRFPVLDKVVMGSNPDCWIYFPKYCTLMSNKITYALCPGDERAYFVQFFDGFNPKAGYGLALITHNFDGVVLDYGLYKTAEGLKYFIQYPAPWHQIAPGAEDKLVETSLVLHTGDWHGGFKAYTDWVKSWYKPVKPGKLEWWTHTWVIYGQLLTKAYDWVIPTYSDELRKFTMVEQLGVSRDRWAGETPLTHVWGWNMPAKLYPGEKKRVGTPNSNYADGEFDPANYRGGADALKAEFARVQNAGSPVSLYTIPAYLPKASPIGRAKGEALTQVLENGTKIEDDQCWFPCSWAWRDTFVEACVRAQAATGCNAIYIDISPFPRDYTCYSADHGHGVPLNTNVSSRRILKEMRERLPEGVALWHEDPACDVDVQYSSGSFTYYAGRTWAHRARNYGESTAAPLLMPAKQSILRFVFPHYKTFALPVGYGSGNVEMDQFAIHFFNGDGVGDATFGMYHDRSIAVVQKIARLQRLHADTFLSSSPEPLVPTLAGGIEANRFPADDGSECIWTFWNGRYSTYRGEVLEVETVPGEVWYDLWNDREVAVTQKDGKSRIALELQPQTVGCIVRTVGKKASN